MIAHMYAMYLGASDDAADDGADPRIVYHIIAHCVTLYYDAMSCYAMLYDSIEKKRKKRKTKKN